MSSTRFPACTPASSTNRSLMCLSARSLNSLHAFHPAAAELQCLCCAWRKSTESIPLGSMLTPPYSRDGRSNHASDAEAVVALPTHGLNRRRFHPGLGGELLMEATLGGDPWVFIVVVDEAAVTNDVVGNDQSAGARV